MLALPRIAAVQGGAGAVGRTSPGKSAGTANNPFIKLLAGLDSVKAERASNAKSAGLQPAARTAKGESPYSARTGSAGRLENQSARTGAMRASPARNARPVPGQGAEAVAGLTAGAGAKAPAGGPSPLAKPDLRQDKPRNGSGAADSPEAAILAGSAGAAAMAAAKSQPQRVQPASPAAGSRGENGTSGFETLGARTEKGHDGARLTVVDMRLKAARESVSRKAADGDNAGNESSREALKAEPARVEADPGFQGRLASGIAGDTDGATPVAGESAAPARTFTESLASRLRDGAADIVRSAQVVLRDGDTGIIRLRLEPESLGGVKIELKMAEKQISGKIVVESDIAGEAFRASLDALRDAFAESGFETTSLEVEVRNGMASGSGGGENGAGDENDPYWSRSLRELDAAVPALASAGRDGLVDMTM